MSRRNRFLTISAVLVCLDARMHAQPRFDGLGDLPGGRYESHAFGVSADGEVVVGESSSEAAGPHFEAFRWTAQGGMVGLGDLPDGTFWSEGRGVSADGSVVVGTGNVQGGTNAFRWTYATDMVSLGDLPGGQNESGAFDTTPDGEVVVGQGQRSLSESGIAAMRNRQGAWVTLEPSGFAGRAKGVSSDGSVVAGNRMPFSGAPREAIRWTAATGSVGLGFLSGCNYSEAYDTSADGSVIVGFSNGNGCPFKAFRWTVSPGLVELPPPAAPYNQAAFATSVSADGAVIGGLAWADVDAIPEPYNQTAVIWDGSGGVRRVEDVLTGLGVDLGGWSLSAVEAVSADGCALVGWGVNPDGDEEAWRARICASPPICPTITQQPSSATLCEGDGVTLNVVAEGTPPLLYQWRKDGIGISGATGDTYVIAAATFLDNGAYDVVVSNLCREVISDAAVVTVWAAGTGDANGDGQVDGADIRAFLRVMLETPSGPAELAFCAADMNRDGTVNQADVILFVDGLLAGG